MPGSWFRGSRTSKGSYHSSGGSRTSARCRVIAQARDWKAAAVDAAAKAARAGALRAHTRTLSLTLPAKAEHAGDVPGRRARIHCARAHSLSIHSVWGRAGLQVLNVASRRRGHGFGDGSERPKYFMHMWCIGRCTYMEPYCIFNAYLTYCLLLAYILLVYMLHIYCILRIVHILHVVHILHIMYIML